MATMSSMMASVSSNIRSAGGTCLPMRDRTPTAKAISVAVGIAQPRRAAGSGLMSRYSSAGMTTPPTAATMGRVATLGSDKAPSYISRRISSPTTRKNTLMSPSLTQKCRSHAGRNSATPRPSFRCHSASYAAAQGEFAQARAMAAAASSTTPLIASTLMKRSGQSAACEGGCGDNPKDFQLLSVRKKNALVVMSILTGLARRTPIEPHCQFKPMEERVMRVMVIVKANKESESGVLPSREILTEMGKFNEELVKAGVMLAGEGLHSSAKGVRVRFGGGKSTVTDGPFTETKELIAGFWLWQVKSMEEAIEWIRRSPFQKGNEAVEIRRVFEAEDFGANATSELRAQEASQRARIAAKN